MREAADIRARSAPRVAGRRALPAEPPPAIDIEHRDRPVSHLNQPGFFQHLQSLTDTLPRRANELTKMFVGDFDATFSIRMELRMEHLRERVSNAPFQLV